MDSMKNNESDEEIKAADELQLEDLAEIRETDSILDEDTPEEETEFEDIDLEKTEFEDIGNIEILEASRDIKNTDDEKDAKVESESKQASIKQNESDYEKEAREEAERRERSEEVRAWLSSDERLRAEKSKARIQKMKARVSKDIFRGGLNPRKKRGEQINQVEQEKTSPKKDTRASELVLQFDKALQSTDKKIGVIQNILNNHNNDKKEVELLIAAANRGEAEGKYVDFLKTQYDNENDLRLIRNLTESMSFIKSTMKLEDLLFNSIRRQLNIRHLLTDFAKEFTEENFQADERIDIKTVDQKIREQKRQRDFYDLMTALIYHNLMAELAYRIAIVATTIRVLLAHKTILINYPTNYFRYEDIDKDTLDRYVEIFNSAFDELTISHDDDCPDDAEKYLRTAYQLNNEVAEFYNKIKEPVAMIAQKVARLRDFLANRKNYTKEKDGELKDILESIEGANEVFELVLDLNEKDDIQSDSIETKNVKKPKEAKITVEDKQEKNYESKAERKKSAKSRVTQNSSTILTLKNYIKTNIEVLSVDAIGSDRNNMAVESLVILSIGEMRILDLVKSYKEAKEHEKALLWKALEAKEKYLPEMQALIMALVNLYQLENKYQKTIANKTSPVTRETVEQYYRGCVGLFEIIFRNLTSITTYIYNVISRQPTDIAADGLDGELVRTLGLVSGVLKEMCRSILDGHQANLLIFIYQKLLNEPENEEYLYFAEVESQIVMMIRKYLPATLMPDLLETSEAMTKAGIILNKYNDLNVSPSGIRDAMTEDDKKEMTSLIIESRTRINHYMSWHTDNGIGVLYSLYDFTVYSPEALINRTNPKEFIIMYLATSEGNGQAKKLSDAEQEIKDGMNKLPQTDKDISSHLRECVGSYEVMLGMFRQFYTLFNQRNTQALKVLRETNNAKAFDKRIMFSNEAQAPQIKNILVNFVRSYVGFSKQYILLVREYIDSLKILYLGLPDLDENFYKNLKYTGEQFPAIQKMLINIRTSLEIIQSDQDPMISKFMKTLLNGVEKCWVGGIDLDAVKSSLSNLNKTAERIISLKENGFNKKETEKLLVILEQDTEPLTNWLNEKEKEKERFKKEN